MNTFQKLYIKFEEGNQESLDRACREAERLGYKKRNHNTSIRFEWEWLLICEEWEYFTSSYCEKTLIDDWYKEHKIWKLKVTDLQQNEAIKFQNEKEYKDISVLLHESWLTRSSWRKYIDWAPAFHYDLMIIPYEWSYCRYGDVDYKIYNASEFLNNCWVSWVTVWYSVFDKEWNHKYTTNQQTPLSNIWNILKPFQWKANDYINSKINWLTNGKKVLLWKTWINEVPDECCDCTEDSWQYEKESPKYNPYLYLFQ